MQVNQRVASPLLSIADRWLRWLVFAFGAAQLCHDYQLINRPYWALAGAFFLIWFLVETLYNWLASRMTGFAVKDLTSGFRAVRADRFKEFLHLLPNGFSYPTTCTMAFFRSAYAVAYEPIPVARRVGKSHIRPLRDGLRFLLIIFKIATLYSPLKLFVPTSALFFLLGAGYYAFTFVTQHRFTNMSMLLFSAAVIVFLIGLISEQITSLTYQRDRS